MKILQRWKQTALHNKALVLSAILGAFGTLFYAGAAVVQIYILKQSAIESTQIAQKIQSALDTANIRNGRALRRTLEQSKEAMDTSNEQSSAVLNANIAASQLEQRPWVYVSSLALTAEPEATKEPPKITITLSNSGKTPAINLRLLYETFSSPTDIPFADLKTSEPIPIGVMPPSATGFVVGTEPVNSVVRTPGHLPAYNEGKDFIYIHIKITYAAVFKGQRYWTTVCAYHTHGSPLPYFTFCKLGNDVGQEEDKKTPN